MTSEPRVSFFLDGSEVGGAERATRNLIAAMAPEPVEILTVHDAVADDLHQLDNATVHRLGPAGPLTVARTLRRTRTELLHVVLPNPFAARVAVLGARLAGVPVVAVHHLPRPADRKRGRRLTRAFATLVAHQVAVGESSARDLVRWFGFDPADVTTIHNGIVDVPVEPLPSRRPPTFGVAARLEEQKAVDRLVRALAEVDGVELAVIGDGSERAALEELAAELGVVDRVDFRGWHDDARTHIAGLDAFVLASRNESFPLTIVEAMLAGVAVIASDVGSVAEAVDDGVTGLLVPEGDHDRLVEAMRTLRDDPDRRAAMGRSGRARAVERFTDDAMLAGYRQVWRAHARGVRR